MCTNLLQVPFWGHATYFFQQSTFHPNFSRLSVLQIMPPAARGTHSVTPHKTISPVLHLCSFLFM